MQQGVADTVAIVLALFVLVVCITRENARGAVGEYWVPFESSARELGDVSWSFAVSSPVPSVRLSVGSQDTV